MNFTGIAIAAYYHIMSRPNVVEAIDAAKLCFPNMPADDARRLYAGVMPRFSDDGNTMEVPCALSPTQ